MKVVPISQKEAFQFVDDHHRHLSAPQGSIFQIGLADGERVVGCIIVGRPIARLNDDGWTVEILRCCTIVANCAASQLMGAAWRAARALGYRRLITYTLDTEPGASLRAAGFKLVGQTKPQSWSRKARPRVDTAPMQKKFKWEQHV